MSGKDDSSSDIGTILCVGHHGFPTESFVSFCLAVGCWKCILNIRACACFGERLK